MSTGRQAEHEWLDRFVGEWTYVMVASAEPGKPPESYEGTESVRSVGGLWVVCEGRGDSPTGEPTTTIMSIGYDPAKRRYRGTFIGSMMPDLWIYEGEVDRKTGNSLTMYTEGPSFTDEGKRASYRDTIEFQGNDQRTLSSRYRDDSDGSWHQFMTTTYRRTR